METTSEHQKRKKRCVHQDLKDHSIHAHSAFEVTALHSSTATERAQTQVQMSLNIDAEEEGKGPSVCMCVCPLVLLL